MGDVNNGQGQNAEGSPDIASPEIPTTPPDVAGQGDAGQDVGQAAPEAAGHDLNPDVTRAQQAAAEARREAEILKARLETMESQQAPAPTPEVDPNQQAFDTYAQKSQVFQQPISELRNVQAQLMDTQLTVNKDKYPHYGQVREKVMADISQLNAVPAAQMNQAIDMIYAKHAQPLVNQYSSTIAQENAQLKARLAELQAGAQRTGVDLGALQAGAAAQQGQVAEQPGPDASLDDLAAFIDRNRQ